MMREISLAWSAAALMLAATSVGCGGDSSLGDGGLCTSDAGAAGDGTRKFGDACDNGCECESGICFTFGDGTRACTQKCGATSDCPSGSQGQKCNQQGYCRV